MICEAKPVSVRICQQHLTRSVRRVLRRLSDYHAARYELLVTSVDIRHHKVCCAPDLAVAGVLSEEDRLPSSRQLHEHGKSGLESVFPIDLESETANVKGEATLRVGHSKLWRDRLN